jgi:hypothetical protein
MLLIIFIFSLFFQYSFQDDSIFSLPDYNDCYNTNACPFSYSLPIGNNLTFSSGINNNYFVTWYYSIASGKNEFISSVIKSSYNQMYGGSSNEYVNSNLNFISMNYFQTSSNSKLIIKCLYSDTDSCYIKLLLNVKNIDYSSSFPVNFVNNTNFYTTISSTNDTSFYFNAECLESHQIRLTQDPVNDNIGYLTMVNSDYSWDQCIKKYNIYFTTTNTFEGFSDQEIENESDEFIGQLLSNGNLRIYFHHDGYKTYIIEKLLTGSHNIVLTYQDNNKIIYGSIVGILGVGLITGITYFYIKKKRRNI